MKTVPIKDIKPNPFRHMERYPIQQDKVEALRESIRATGFWGNVVARIQDGEVQLAYGHHRLAALKEEYGDDHEVELIVRHLDDESMLKMMGRENMAEWASGASIEHETVRAVVLAYAEGKVPLPPPNPKTSKNQLRYAPSFMMGDAPSASPPHPYTDLQVAQFLGWVSPSGKPQDKVRYALSALELIEQSLLTEDDFKDLTTSQAKSVVIESNRVRQDRELVASIHEKNAKEAKREAEKTQDPSEKKQHEKRATAAEGSANKFRQNGKEVAGKVARKLGEKFKAGEISTKQARDVADELSDFRIPKRPPEIHQFADRLATNIGNILDADRDKQRVGKLDMIIEHKDGLLPAARNDLARTLSNLAAKIEHYAKQLRVDLDEPEPAVKKPQRSLKSRPLQIVEVKGSGE